MKAGETLLVLGAAGGVGTAAVELGKLLGGKVIAARNQRDARQGCQRDMRHRQSDAVVATRRAGAQVGAWSRPCRAG
jgi:NADPH:quinone reductase-like Zn-dependent oxidoreductase